ncbi:hypothetical protein KIN20_021522 [Parelaphostrongylus tenuis]|uniref:Nucleolus and neural progenitor protein-like N-terminal domain-containing protein n=1 Tax=Parelaphostrongylus tenuis TaxID=148309 RepID=A0AAD5MPF4_PARTN|nr:hypothetical protein KIN20_021522 [Parelaphostrongylus tenuis]
MNWHDEYADLLQLVDQTTATYPRRVFNVASERDSTPVRQVAFALENMLDQLKKPLVPSTQSLAQALVYKFNAAHRRQGYWRNYKNLVRMLRKYNEDDLLIRVSDLHKKTTASGAGFNLPSVDVLRYVGGAYLKRLFRLQQIQDLCIRTAHVIMGQLELGHWEKFSLVIVALCADINNGIGTQVTSMESVYAGFSKFLKPLDSRFPGSLTQLPIFSTLRGQAAMKKTVDTARVMRLLQLSDEQLEAVHVRDQMLKFRDEMLSNMERKEEEVDLGVDVDRTIEDAIDVTLESFQEDVPVVESKASAKSESGVESSSGVLSSNIHVNEDEDEHEQINAVLKRNERSVKRLRNLKRRKMKEEKFVGSSTCSVASPSTESILRVEGHGTFSSPISSRNNLPLEAVVSSKRRKRRRRNGIRKISFLQSSIFQMISIIANLMFPLLRAHRKILGNIKKVASKRFPAENGRRRRF